jgi:glyoxylase-like metal-dependent hydrolase (beta-lactamase superfamily II)
MASTLIYGTDDAALTDPGMTADQARVLGDWVAARGRNLTDIFITHGHDDHWFAIFSTSLRTCLSCAIECELSAS